MGPLDESTPTPKSEARMLLSLLERGASTDEVRALISVSPREERLLRAFAETEPVAGGKFLAAIEFRANVLREFDKMLARRARSLARPLARVLRPAESLPAMIPVSLLARPARNRFSRLEMYRHRRSCALCRLCAKIERLS